MKRLAIAYALAFAAALSVSGCGDLRQTGVVTEKEYEPKHYDKKKKKTIAECYEIELDTGAEFCVGKSEFDRLKVGDVRR